MADIKHEPSDGGGGAVTVEDVKLSPGPPKAHGLFSPSSPVDADRAQPPAGPSSSSSSPGLLAADAAAQAAPSPARRGRKKKAATPPPRILIPDLPDAWDAAHDVFEALDKCVYERRDLGLSREQDEMMVCDCVWDRDDPDADPCGHYSDCINRAIFIECLADECRAGRHCRNQQQYAKIDVVQTEMKGFGLRAAADIPAGSLIYEYIGEVVAEKTFRRRMAQYADEGIKHFYFMMLQKEEYIDATKKGGIGRFANHSCNPNCEVQKWVVGRRLRMGIFSQRDIDKGEEITFNYNVDRYGHEAQICYCGEPNCVGTIGGKTQTDLGAMNPLFLDALGITDEVEEMGMKGSKKKKSRQLDEDYVPILHPIEAHEVPKVAAAIRQSMENKRMMSRLLERIRMTEEPAIQRALMRMHGFSLMTMILTELAAERDIAQLALESMAKWKITMRNKVEDSKIEEPVQALADGPDVELAALAKELLAYWSTLELSYKIPRVSKIASLDDEDDRNTTTIAEANSAASRRRTDDALANTASVDFVVAPVRFGAFPPPVRRAPPPAPPPQPITRAPSAFNDRSKLDAIIALAAASAPPPPPPVTESPAAESSTSGSRKDRDDDGLERDRERSHSERKRARTEADEDKKARRLTKMIGEVVVQSMSKYKAQMSHDTFKRYARECTSTLVEKEKRGHSYASARHPHLSDDKKAKIKAFTKEYAHKILKKLKDRGQLKRGQSSASLSRDGEDGAGHDRSVQSTPSFTATAPSDVLATPHDGDDLVGDDLVDDVFGDDVADLDLDMDINGTPSVRGSDSALGNGGDTPRPPDTAAGTPRSKPTADFDMALPSPSISPTRPKLVDHLDGLSMPRGPRLVDHFGGNFQR